jgi:hypothetical protein
MSLRKEAMNKGSSIFPIHRYKNLNFIKGSLAVCKIIYPSLDGKGYIGGTGFFIKFKDVIIRNKFPFVYCTFD